jgi:hypothetical protein
VIGAILLPLAVAPVLIGAVAAAIARPASQRLAPAPATALLTGLALTVALVTGLLLSLAAVVAALELSPALGLDHWSPARLRHHIPMPSFLGVLTGLVAAALLASAGLHLYRVARQLRRTGRAAAQLRALGDDLVLLEDDDLIAYAVPGRHRRIVVSVGLLAGLTAPQRRAVLAHEAAHLRYRHHLYVQLARLAAAANPLVRPVSRAVDLAVERWADEDAAREVGDRVTVARAVASAVLGDAPVPVGALAAAETDVVARVRILLQPQRHRWPIAFALAAAILACWTTGGLVIGHVHALMELSESVAHR